MASAKFCTIATAIQRRQVSQAVLQGFLDSVIAADLTTAKNNGYIPDAHVEAQVDVAPIQAVNR